MHTSTGYLGVHGINPQQVLVARGLPLLSLEEPSSVTSSSLLEVYMCISGVQHAPNQGGDTDIVKCSGVYIFSP